MLIPQPSSNEACHRSGVILTCYLNGRKLFRAVRLDASILKAETGMIAKVAGAQSSRR